MELSIVQRYILPMKRSLLRLLGLALLVLPPLAGRRCAGWPVGFTEFPPLTTYIEHAPFSWPVYLLFAGIGLMAGILLIRPTWFEFAPPLSDVPIVTRAFPWWGWAGMILCATGWVCAWGHYAWLGPVRDHTFTPIWLGYIFTMDGLVYRRTGQSLLTRTPGTFAALFPASAVTWWYFEYLNRFVQNWR